MNKFRESAYKSLTMLNSLAENSTGLVVLLDFYHIRAVMYEVQKIIEEIPNVKQVVQISFTNNTLQHMSGAKVKITTAQNAVQDCRGRILQDYFVDDICKLDNQSVGAILSMVRE